jgi:hypothetical protein
MLAADDRKKSAGRRQAGSKKEKGKRKTFKLEPANNLAGISTD